jgi:hypothetical protein
MRKPIVLALIFCIGLSIFCSPGRVSACVCSPRGDKEREDVLKGDSAECTVTLKKANN